MKTNISNKIDEHWLVPIIFIAMTFSLFLGAYFLNESIKDYGDINQFYIKNKIELANYKYNNRLSALYTFLLFLGQSISIKIKKRWMYLFTICLSAVLIVSFFKRV